MKSTNPSNFQSLEVVDRGSETQLQVTENVNFIAQCSEDYLIRNCYAMTNLQIFDRLEQCYNLKSTEERITSSQVRNIPPAPQAVCWNICTGDIGPKMACGLGTRVGDHNDCLT